MLQTLLMALVQVSWLLGLELISEVGSIIIPKALI